MRVFALPFRWLAGTSAAHSLRVRLTLLVLLAALPALGLLLLTASEQRTDAITAGQSEARRVARLAAANQDGLIDQTRLLLNTLARLPEVQASDLTQCGPLFTNLVAADPRYTNLGVVDRDGAVACSAVSNEAAGSAIDAGFVQRVFENNAFTIGTYGAGSVDGRPTIYFALPAETGSGPPTHIVFAALNLGDLDTFANQADLQEGSILTILDAEGTVILRYPFDPAVLGTSLADTPAVRDLLTSQSGVTIAELPDGDEYVFAFERVVPVSEDNPGIGTAYITVAVPEEAVVEAANETFRRNLGRLGIVALLSMVAAWVLSDVFVRRDGETRKTLVAELYQAFGSGGVDLLDDMIASDFVDRSPSPGQARGIEGVKQVIAGFRTAFPDGAIVPQELLADRDKVVARVTLTGTHVGDFFGLPPSGKAVTADGVETFRFAGGLIVESWSMFGEIVPVLRPEVVPNGRGSERERRGLFGRLFNRGRAAAERNGG